MTLPTVGLVQLPDLGVVRVSGDDARAFLQGQLTADLRKISPSRAALAAWCNPQGRALFLMHVLGTEDSFLLSLPAADIERFVKRLRMFVLRAKVSIEDLRGQWAVAGVMGAMAPAPVADISDAAPFTAHEGAGLRVCRLPGVLPRALLLGDAAALATWLGAADLPAVTVSDWWAQDALGGQPRVDGATAERFIPQQLNLDRLGMMSFDKGCYPGQEVIARLKYRGQIKARLRTGTSAFELSPGARLYAPGASGGQSAGEVLSVVPTPTGCIFTAVIDLTASGDLHANAPDGPLLTVAPDPGD